MNFFLVFTIVWVLDSCIDAFEYNDGLWRKSLEVCWTDPSCIRKMTISHGGDWNLSLPYDSQPAFEKAFDVGADAVKGDFRVSKDNIGMVMHSSPILAYESFDCVHRKVEEHTASQNSACHMAYTDYTFTSVPDVLKWANNKINFMFCVKESTDIPRAISTLIENKATHRAFLEIGVGNMLNTVHAEVEGWADVYYIIEIRSVDDFNSMISAGAEVLKRTFLFEFNDWTSWVRDDLIKCIDITHSMGINAVTASNSDPITSTVKNHLDIYKAGFDVAYTYNLDNSIEARKIINTENLVFPA